MTTPTVPYQRGVQQGPVADGEGPPCEHGPECEVRQLWPLDKESHAQFVARVRAQYRAAPPHRPVVEVAS